MDEKFVAFENVDEDEEEFEEMIDELDES